MISMARYWLSTMYSETIGSLTAASHANSDVEWGEIMSGQSHLDGPAFNHGQWLAREDKHS